ncbi:MAG: YebC/PmpR family DNA-binding transcriptional regulator, partial [Dehalococcoidia bacterium]|nr:YebC/PmpR family DNA-binding transcriptional regulator [Dehalococcoidia bacterium]
MSGHSKWSKIKRQKVADDAKRGQVFTKLTREIIVAAREGGGNPEANFRLRLAIQKARDANMPSENINRAIQKGIGGGGEGSGQLTEITFEGYGPKGVAVLVEAVTDNRNRTVQEVRSLFTKFGGSLGATGSVSWLFESKGVITVDATGNEAEDLAMTAIEHGAEDVKIEKGYIEIYTKPKDLEAVRKAIEAKKPVSSAEVLMEPKNTVMLEGEDVAKVLNFLERLEELDDVQKVASNLDFSEATLE